MSDNEKLHIVPLNDLREHELTGECWCNPSDEDYGVLHFSADGRESYEHGSILGEGQERRKPN